MENKVLLIGNDINNATSNYTWENLLDDLIDYAQLTKKPSNEKKPFPLLYEEIYLNSAFKYGIKESRFKKNIASKTRHLLPNDIHNQILKLGIKTIFTTNYDFTLEKVLTDNIKNLKNSGYIKESLYNIFRIYKINDYNFWHIHGSELAPNTITLGYEHYSGYLQQMRNYVVTGTKGNYRKKDFLPLHTRFNENSINHESWIDYFFTHKIDILGLKLDFVEMDLWWLLTYRSRARVSNKIKSANIIRYFYPKKYESESKHKLELLNANGIITIPIIMYDNDRIKYYKKVLKYIKDSP